VGRGCIAPRILDLLLLTTVSRMGLRPTQPPTQWVRGAPLGIKRPGREDDHSPQSSAFVKNEWRYTSTPPIRLNGCLVKHTDNLVNYKTVQTSTVFMKTSDQSSFPQ